MFRQVYECEVKLNERTYRFTCENNSPLGEIYDVLTMIKNHIVQRISEIEDRESTKKSEKEETFCCSENVEIKE